MITFDLVLKILISTIIGYLVLNSIFKFHVFNDLLTAGFVSIYVILMIFYTDREYHVSFLIISIVLLSIYIGLLIFQQYKKVKYFLLLNIRKNDFTRVSTFLSEQDLKENSYSYNKKYPYILKFNNIKPDKTRKIMKSFEKKENKNPKTFTICNYWLIIIFLTMMVVIWRF